MYTGDGDLSDADVARAAALIEEAGGRDRTVVEARQHLDAALDSLEGVDLVETVIAELVGLACFVTDRDF